MLKSYMTIKGHATAIYEEKRSRFISQAMSVEDEEGALSFINNIKNSNKEASHNAYAYSVGLDSAVCRFSDDGEPGGTAGLPILEIIRKRNLLYSVIVVTRYFGGILLGAQGLTRAYGKAASAAVDAAGIVVKIPVRDISVNCSHNLAGKIQGRIMQSGYKIKNISYGEDVLIVSVVPAQSADAFIGMVNTIASGACRVIPGNIYHDIYHDAAGL